MSSETKDETEETIADRLFCVEVALGELVDAINYLTAMVDTLVFECQPKKSDRLEQPKE